MASKFDGIQSYVLRQVADVQTDTSLIWIPPTFKHRTFGTATDSVQRQGIRLKRFSLQNAAAASPVGIGFRYINPICIGGRLSEDGVTYTDLTSSLFARTAATVQVVGADQTGFVIGCREKFGWASVNFSTAETNAGGATVVDHTVAYSLGATWSSAYGSGLEDDFTTTDAVWGTGIKNFVWQPASDWAKSAALGGVPDGYYWLRFTSAHREASDVAAIVTGVEIGSMAAVALSLAQNGLFEEDYINREDMPYSPFADAIVVYFGTANGANAYNGSAEGA